MNEWNKHVLRSGKRLNTDFNFNSDSTTLLWSLFLLNSTLALSLSTPQNGQKRLIILLSWRLQG